MFLYPAPGSRHYGNSTLCSVGYAGYNYSSAVSGSNACNLNFNDNWLNPQFSNYRAYGFPVRCLQE